MSARSFPGPEVTDTVFFEVRHGTLARSISTYCGKLKITLSRHGVPFTGMTFQGVELILLADAVQSAERRLSNVAPFVFPRKSGAAIEVSAVNGAVVLRTRPPVNGRRIACPMYPIVGHELVGLRLALEDLQTTAARAAL